MKKTAMYKRYGDKRPIGTIALCGTFGAQFYKPDEHDKYDCDYIVCWHNGDYGYGYHKHMIHYTTSGRAYIRKGSLRIYLDTVMRV